MLLLVHFDTLPAMRASIHSQMPMLAATALSHTCLGLLLRLRQSSLISRTSTLSLFFCSIESPRPGSGTSLGQTVAIVQLEQVSSSSYLVWNQLEGKQVRRDFESSAVACRLQWALCHHHYGSCTSHTRAAQDSVSAQLFTVRAWAVQLQDTGFTGMQDTPPQ